MEYQSQINFLQIQKTIVQDKYRKRYAKSLNLIKK